MRRKLSAPAPGLPGSDFVRACETCDEIGRARGRVAAVREARKINANVPAFMAGAVTLEEKCVRELDDLRNSHVDRPESIRTAHQSRKQAMQELRRRRERLQVKNAAAERKRLEDYLGQTKKARGGSLPYKPMAVSGSPRPEQNPAAPLPPPPPSPAPLPPALPTPHLSQPSLPHPSLEPYTSRHRPPQRFSLPPVSALLGDVPDYPGPERGQASPP